VGIVRLAGEDRMNRRMRTYTACSGGIGIVWAILSCWRGRSIRLASEEHIPGLLRVHHRMGICDDCPLRVPAPEGVPEGYRHGALGAFICDPMGVRVGGSGWRNGQMATTNPIDEYLASLDDHLGGRSRPSGGGSLPRHAAVSGVIGLVAVPPVLLGTASSGSQRASTIQPRSNSGGSSPIR
jgi:hypothetical protein